MTSASTVTDGQASAMIPATIASAPVTIMEVDMDLNTERFLSADCISPRKAAVARKAQQLLAMAA